VADPGPLSASASTSTQITQFATMTLSTTAQTALQTELAQRWAVIVAAREAPLSFYLLEAQWGGGTPRPVGLAGNASAYRTASRMAHNTPLNFTQQAALSTSMSVLGLEPGAAVSFYTQVGNRFGVSQPSAPSIPVQISTTACERFSVTIDPRTISQVAASAPEGAFAFPAVLGASPPSAFAHQGQDSSTPAGLLRAPPNTLDARLGDASWTTALRVPAQPTAVSAASPLLLSHVSTPMGLGFELTLPNRPGANEQVTVQCTSSEPARLAVAPSMFAFDASTAPGGFRQWMRVTQVVQRRGAVLDPTAWQLDVQVRCSVQSAVTVGAQVYADVPEMVVPLRLLPAILPLFGDVLTQLPDGSHQSAWGRSAADSGLPASLPGVESSYQQILASVNTAPVAAAGSVAAGASAFEAFPAAPSAKQQEHFSIVMGGLQNITIVADCAHRLRCLPSVATQGFPAAGSALSGAAQPFAFAPGTRVFLGSTELGVTAVSSDGLALQAVAPSYRVMCPTDADCAGAKAYRMVWLANPPVIPSQWLQHVRDTWIRRSTRTASSNEWVFQNDPMFSLGRAQWTAAAAQEALQVGNTRNSVLGGTSACPMACPGAGANPTASSLGRRRQLQTASSSTLGYGTFVTDVCVGYLPPGPKCRDETDPDHKRCAYGGGDSCEPCGEGALCPGGFRRWPKLGFWAAAESSVVGVQQCAPPSLERCLGWDVASSSSLCGAGYRGFRCSQCDIGFFPESGGACSACPEQQGGLELLIPVLIFAGAALLLFLIMVAVIYYVVSSKGGSVRGGIFTAAQFVAWTVSMLQVIVQVGKAASPGLPDFLQDMYTRLNVLQFDSSGFVHPTCVSQEPFLHEKIILGVTIVLMLAALAITCLRVRKQPATPGSISKGKSAAGKNGQTGEATAGAMVGVGCWAAVKPRVRQVLFTLLTLLYALVCNTVLGLLYCQKAQVDTGGQAEGKWLLVSNPFYECFAGEHVLPGYMALCMLGVYVIGYPLLTFLWVRRKIHAVLIKSRSSQAYHDALSKARAVKSARAAVRQSAAQLRKRAAAQVKAASDSEHMPTPTKTLTGPTRRFLPSAETGYDSDEEAMLAAHIKAAKLRDAVAVPVSTRKSSTVARKANKPRSTANPMSWGLW